MTKISMIVAVSENNVIGDGKEMPWHLPDDFKWFRQHTLGKPILMGRKTFESIGRPLPDRRNLVLTRCTSYTADGCEVVHSVDAALSLVDNEPELMVIGGGELYRHMLPYTQTVYLTRVHASVQGTVKFPVLAPTDWECEAHQQHPVDDKHAYSFTFYTYNKHNH